MEHFQMNCAISAWKQRGWGFWGKKIEPKGVDLPDLDYTYA